MKIDNLHKYTIKKEVYNMVFAQLKEALDNAVKKINQVWPFARKKLEFSEEIKNKLLKIAYIIIEIMEEVEEEVEESKEEVEEILDPEEEA